MAMARAMPDDAEARDLLARTRIGLKRRLGVDIAKT
jgi:hypothetical protein